MDLISEIVNNPDKLSNNFENDGSSSNSGSSNIISIKCTKALFSKEGLINNISSYILLIFIGQFLLSIVMFLKCGYKLLINEIEEILIEKEKIKKQINNSNDITDNNLLTKENNNKRINNRNKKKNFPPKKYKLNFVNNNNQNNKIKNLIKKQVNNTKMKKVILNLINQIKK